MPHGIREGAKRRRRDGGAALVEAALVVPIVLLIVLAVFELGMMFKSATVASSASRAGVRLASSQFANATTNAQRDSAAALIASSVAEVLRDRNSGDTPEILRVYRSTSTGTPVGGNYTTCSNDCLRFTWNGSGWTYDTSSRWDDADACGATLDSVGVYLTVRHVASNNLIPLQKTIDEHSVMRLEPRLGTNVCTGPGGES